MIAFHLKMAPRKAFFSPAEDHKGVVPLSRSSLSLSLRCADIVSLSRSRSTEQRMQVVYHIIDRQQAAHAIRILVVDTLGVSLVKDRLPSKASRHVLQIKPPRQFVIDSPTRACLVKLCWFQPLKCLQ
jgi:hypothetical protein